MIPCSAEASLSTSHSNPAGNEWNLQDSGLWRQDYSSLFYNKIPLCSLSQHRLANSLIQSGYCTYHYLTYSEHVVSSHNDFWFSLFPVWCWLCAKIVTETVAQRARQAGCNLPTQNQTFEQTRKLLLCSKSQHHSNYTRDVLTQAPNHSNAFICCLWICNCCKPMLEA